MTFVCCILFLFVFFRGQRARCQSSNPQSVKELVNYDLQLNKLIAESTETLEDYVGLALLFHMREEMWKQGGDWESLYWTEKAFQLMDSGTKMNTELQFALQIHYVRILTILGKHNDATAFGKKIITELQAGLEIQNKSYAKFLAQLYYAQGSAYLAGANFIKAAAWFTKALSIYPCLHQTYYQLAVAMTSLPTKQANEIFYYLNHWESLLNRILLEPDRVWLITSELNDAKQCAFGDELQYLDVLLEHSQVSPVAHHSSSTIEEMSIATGTTLNFGKRSTLNFYKVIKASIYWALFTLSETLCLSSLSSRPNSQLPSPYYFLLNNDKLCDKKKGTNSNRDIGLSFFYLSQARAYERFRLHPSIHQSPYYQHSEALYSLTESMVQTKHVIDTFSASYYPSPNESYGSSSQRPVFIVGFFRSGSTLLETLLHKHPYIWGLGEHSAFANQLHLMQDEMLLLADEFDRYSKKYKTEEKKVQRYRQVLQKHANLVDAMMLQRCLQFSFSNVSVSTAIEAENARQCSRVVDKMLLNYRNIGFIHLMFPHSIILHTVRDPLDTLWSCITHRFGDASAYTLDMKTLVQEYGLYLHVTHHFRSTLPRPLHSTKSSPHFHLSQQTDCDNHINNSLPLLCAFNSKLTNRQKITKSCCRDSALWDVRYDVVVSASQQIMDEIYELLDISNSLNTSTISLSQSSSKQRQVRTASYLQVQQNITRTRVGRWKEYSLLLRYSLLPLLREEIQRLQDELDVQFDPIEGEKYPMNWFGSEDYKYRDQIENLDNFIQTLNL
jgi:tetratricopeptide (TPR) repeat protein